MSATLSGGGAFDISPSGPQTQWIDREEVTTWVWSLAPKTAGTQYLILSFDALITENGKDGTRNVNILRRKIEVEVRGQKRRVNGLVSQEVGLRT
jgi:hypothetical protein